MNLDRRFLLIGALCAALLLAIPSLAAARGGYVTGSEQSGGAYAQPIDLASQTVNEAKKVSFGGESSASDVAITPDGTRAYVVVSNNTVVPFNIANSTAGTPIPVGPVPTQIAITPDGKQAYVTNLFGDSVSRIDLASGTVTGTIPVGQFPIGIAITLDGTRAYVANNQSDTVSRIDLATAAVTSIPVGNGPTGISITPDGSRAYVTNQFDSTVSRIDLATDTVVATIATPSLEGRNLAITPAGDRAYVAGDFGSASEVLPIPLATDTPATGIPLSGFPEDIAIAPDGSRAYVPAQVPDLMHPIDLTTNTALTGFAVGNRPEAIAIVPNQPPEAKFTSSSPGQAQQAVSFDATATKDTDTSLPIARYEWDFGDGTAALSSGPKPQHVYAKAGTYQVTLTTTDGEGCSTKVVFTGQTAFCNGSAIARTTHPVVVAGSGICPSVKASASTFVPKRRPGNVLPGVRVRLDTGVPAKLVVTATLIYPQGGKQANAGLGKISVDVNQWRRVRFAIPAELRETVPLGRAVKVKVRIETTPRDGLPCEASVVNRTLKVHVVKVFPDRVQSQRPR